MKRLRDKEPIDRVPVNLAGNLYAARITGTPFREFWTNPEKAFQAQSLTSELHGSDEQPAYTYGWSDWIVSELGGEVQFPDHDYGMSIIARTPVQRPGDIDNLVFPDPWSGPVMSQKLKYARIGVDRGGKAGIQGGISRMVGAIVGYEQLLRWYYTEPNAVHLLYRKVADYILRIIDLYVEEFGADRCTFSEGAPMDSQNVISPKTFEKFGFIYNREIHQKVIAHGIPITEIHLCGNHTRTLHLWKEITPVRTAISIGHEMDIGKTAEFFGPDYIITGNVPTQLLHYGTADEVREKCRQIIDQVKYHPGGFILRTACGMPAEAPPANVHAMVKAARLYGRYD
jgi:uroporphyrinogen decarboxylase